MRDGINRRKLLRGIGLGSAFLAPFARHRLVHAAPAGNFMIMGTHNGFVRSSFGGSGEGTSMQLLPSLVPLTPHKQDLIVVRGLNHKSASSMQSHEDYCRVMSCTFSGGDKNSPAAATFDHMLGAHLGSRPLTLAGQPVRGPDNYTGLSWVAPRKPDPFFNDPRKAFEAVFGGMVPKPPTHSPGEPGVDPIAQQWKRRKSVLDFVHADITDFKGRLSRTDGANLDLYTDALRDLETSLMQKTSMLEAVVPSAPTMAVCETDAARTRVQTAPASAVSPEAYRLIHEAQMDVAATAMACGLRRIASLSFHTNFNPIGGKDYHAVSHGEAPKSVWEGIDKWNAERFAYLIGKFRSVGMLDHTIILWGNEIAEDHNQHDCVFLLAGGKALGMRVGRAVRYPVVSGQRSSSNRSFADLYVSIQKALGLKSEVFGDPQHCTGGLKEIYAG
jgi:hypothetical protein